MKSIFDLEPKDPLKPRAEYEPQFPPGRPGTRMVAGLTAAAFTFASLPHGSPCRDPGQLEELYCESEPMIHHLPHIELNGSTTSSTASATIVTALLSTSTR